MIRLLTLACASVLVAVTWAVGVGAPAKAVDCSAGYDSAITSGSGTGVLTVNGESAASSCPKHPTAPPDGHFEVDPDPVCGLGGEAICYENQQCDGTGLLYGSSWVPTEGEPAPGPAVCVGGEQDPPPAQVTGVRVLQAFKTIPLPTPTLGMSPPDGVTLVNLPTIFYTRAEPFGRDVRVLGRRVHLEIAPVSYSWSVGQGGEFETSWPGSPYQRGVTPQEDPDAYVTWAYDDAGATEAARVRVVWGATWSLDGRPMGRVPGTVEMTSPAVMVTVKEARPVLTGS